MTHYNNYYNSFNDIFLCFSVFKFKDDFIPDHRYFVYYASGQTFIEILDYSPALYLVYERGAFVAVIYSGDFFLLPLCLHRLSSVWQYVRKPRKHNRFVVHLNRERGGSERLFDKSGFGVHQLAEFFQILVSEFVTRHSLILLYLYFERNIPSLIWNEIRILNGYLMKKVERIFNF